MPTLLHLATGAALGRLHARRPSLRQGLAFAALACLPDLDLVLHFAGVPYGDALGHRGAAHSLAAATAVGLLLGLLRLAGPGSRDLRAAGRLALLAALAMASHGLLDMLTHGGHGVGLFWPLDPERHAFSWRPIPAAPLGMAFFGPRGLAVLQAEGPASALLFLLAALPGARAQRATISEGPETLSSS